MEKTKSKARTKKSKISKVVSQGLEALLEQQAPNVVELKYGEGDNELVVSVYSVIPFVERTNLVKGIVDSVFSGDKSVVDSYTPEFLKLAQRYCVVKYFTNLNLPSNIEDLWCVLNFTTIYDDVVKVVGEKEIADILDSANKKIDTYRLYVANKSDTNAIMNNLKDSFSQVSKQLPRGEIRELISSVKGLFSGVDLQEMINSIAIGKVDNKDKN